MPREDARTITVAFGNRGQSSVLGVVLIVGVTVMGITGIMLFGTTAIQDSQTRSEIDSAEHAMTQLDSQFSLVALGSAEHQGASVPVRSGSSMSVNAERGWMNVSVSDSDDGNFTIFNTTLGAVTYENDGTTLAYQGGGVWKRTPDGGSVMVSPPEFHYRKESGDNPTLTLPLVVVRGNGSIAGEAKVQKDQTISWFPNESDSSQKNPLSGGEINVTIHSDYYEAWGAFFEERTGGSVTYDHDRERVTITMVVEKSQPGVNAAIMSGSSGTLDLKKDAEIDSYNSTVAPYGSGEANTSIVTAGTLNLKNDARVKGDVVAGDSVDMHSQSEITGNVTYGVDLDDSGTIGGWTKDGAEVSIPDPVDWLISNRIDDLEASNENDQDSTIDENTNQVDCSSPCTLSDGDYYVEDFVLEGGDELEIATNGNPTTIAVDGDVLLNNDAKIEVTGGGTVRFYVDGHLDMKSHSNVTVPGDRSPGMWFYMNPGANAWIRGHASLVGVIYGPGGGANSGVDIHLKSNAEVFGGLVGTVDDVKSDHYVHFDEALVGVNPIAGYGTDRPTITYLHVTENRVNVSAR